jgi:flavin reductase (DIM6/NTAB) family NADH-FMN oxidoreductase RutF
VTAPRPTTVRPAKLRRTLSLFCTGVTVITSVGPDGAPRGMTANAFMSGSLVPALVVVSIHVRARLHETVSAAEVFGVSILPETLEREARRFAGLPVAAHEPRPEFRTHAGIPVLAGAMAWLVARVSAHHEVGDHTLFVGEVLACEAADSVQPPLAYHRSGFARVALPTSAEPAIDPWSGGIRDLWG